MDGEALDGRPIGVWRSVYSVVCSAFVEGIVRIVGWSVSPLRLPSLVGLKAVILELISTS